MGAAMAPVEVRLGQYIPNRWYACITRTLSKIVFPVVPTACDILFERIATYARISTGNQAACLIPALPRLLRISSNPDRRPGRPHQRTPRPFLLFRPRCITPACLPSSSAIRKKLSNSSSRICGASVFGHTTGGRRKRWRR